MDIAFYLAAAIAIIATALVVMMPSAIHALLYLIVSLLAVAVVFYVLGAPFVAALEVVVYAGAIMVLFVFVMMMLNLGRAAATAQERTWLRPTTWIGPAVLAALLLVELAYVLLQAAPAGAAGRVVDARQVGALLFGPYLLGVELASMLLLAALVGAYHLGWRDREDG